MLRFAFLFLLFLPAAAAQLPYTQLLYQDTVIKDIVYGTDINFAGKPEVLKLDLYKPLGNPYCNRPILVMIHGGAWIGGDKTDGGTVAIAHEYARRGYVVASINYRLGNHKRNFYTPYALCSTVSAAQPCLYVADSSEVIRATYRAMQDAKAAMRFMKSRGQQDSTDYKIGFYGGESAGAFTAFLATFLTTPDEKPVDCFGLPDAPTPDPNLTFCLPANYSLARPDLGSVEGTVNIQTGFDAKAIGVLDFFGGIVNLNILNGPDKPAVYLFHQYGDLIVDCNTMPLLQPLYAYCVNPINLCQPLDHYPIAAGGCSLKSIFQNKAYGPDLLLSDFVTTTTYNCLANPPQHAIDNPALRAANSAAFFAPIIAAHGNAPSSGCISSQTEAKYFDKIIITPTIARDYVSIEMRGIEDADLYRLIGASGRLEQSGKIKDLNAGEIDIHQLPAGLHFLFVNGRNRSYIGKFYRVP
ncbi:MAG: alpha/beta hydrolase [Bacteroidota bacterium]